MRLLGWVVLGLVGASASIAAPAQKPATKKAAAAKAAPVARDWRRNVVKLPTGYFAIGNPAAKVKLVEYLSYTCPHCAHFVAQSKAPLHDDLVRRGLVRIEFRHAVRDPLDMGAALLARCAGARGFVGASEAIFASQATWYTKGATWWQANAAAIQSQPEIARVKAAANAAGLTDLMRARGVTPAAINQCFATPADLNALTAMTAAAWKQIQGTPSFIVNGQAIGSGDWTTLEPQLRAAGAN